MDRDAQAYLGEARALTVEIDTYDIGERRQTDIGGDPEVVGDTQDRGSSILSGVGSVARRLRLDLSGADTESAEQAELRP